MLTIDDVSPEIISLFNKRANDYDFDAHEFISVLEKSYPRIYYRALLKFIPTASAVESAYQQFHAAIGKSLSENRTKYGIRFEGKHNSLNYKGEESENSKWSKI